MFLRPVLAVCDHIWSIWSSFDLISIALELFELQHLSVHCKIVPEKVSLRLCTK